MRSAMVATMSAICFFPLVTISFGRKARAIATYRAIAVLPLARHFCAYITLYLSP